MRNRLSKQLAGSCFEPRLFIRKTKSYLTAKQAKYLRKVRKEFFLTIIFCLKPFVCFVCFVCFESFVCFVSFVSFVFKISYEKFVLNIDAVNLSYSKKETPFKKQQTPNSVVEIRGKFSKLNRNI